jgi:parallel beta-helix repeat protein
MKTKPQKMKVRRIGRKRKALPPHTWEAHPTANQGEINKTLIIAVVAILAIMALAALLFFSDTFVGKATFAETGMFEGKFGFIATDTEFELDEITKLPLIANFGLQEFSYFNITLSYDTEIFTVDCTPDVVFANLDKEFNYLSAELDLVMERNVTCNDGQINLLYSVLPSMDGIPSLTGNMILAELNFTADTLTDSATITMGAFEFSEPMLPDYVITMSSYSNLDLSVGGDGECTLDPECAEGSECIDGLCVIKEPESLCGTIVNADLTLEEDLLGCAGDYALGVMDGSKDFTIDCAGHKISGTGTENNIGVYVIESESITIKNCVVENFHTGIHLSAGGNHTILNNSLTNNTYDGLRFGNTADNLIKDNKVEKNFRGIELSPGNGELLVWNEGNVFTNNTVCGNTEWDFLCYNSSLNILNTGSGNKFGIIDTCADGFPNSSVYTECAAPIVIEEDIPCTEDTECTAAGSYCVQEFCTNVTHKIILYDEDDGIDYITTIRAVEGFSADVTVYTVLYGPNEKKLVLKSQLIEGGLAAGDNYTAIVDYPGIVVKKNVIVYDYAPSQSPTVYGTLEVVYE